MKLIDFEHHFYDHSTIEAMERRKGYPHYDRQADVIHWNELIKMPQGPLLKRLLDIGDERVKMMDKLGISTAIISTAQGVEDLDPSESVELAKKTNNTIYELTKRYPGRFLGSAILPVRDVKAACNELERCVSELGFVCWHTHSNYGPDASPEQEEYLPLFQKAAELGVFIYLHPTLPHFGGLGQYGFTLAGPGAGFTVDTMLAVLKLIVSGVFDKVPETRLLLGHLGEAIPFLLERIDNRINFLPNPSLKNRENPSYYFKNNIMVTTSGNMSKEAFKCTQDVLGIENILFGSDYPFESAEDIVNFVNSLPLTSEEREMLYYRNAEKLGIYAG